MKLLKKDLKHGKMVVKAESLDDLWLLGQTVRQGDAVVGRTTRKVKLGSSEEAVKKTYVLQLAVEGAEFKEQSVRISGKTAEPAEDVPKGSFHTLAVEQGDVITIIKAKWQKYELDRLNEATQQQLKILIVVFDRESCLLARLKSRGYDVVLELKGKVRKKDYSTASVTNFYKEIIASVKDYSERNKPDKIILASPAFWKEEFLNEIKNDAAAGLLKQKLVMATCSSVGENAIEEVLKRPEMETALESAAAAKELKLVEEVMTEIAKDGNAVYGAKEVENAVLAGAAEKLLITDTKVYNNPCSELLMKQAEDNGGKVIIINSENTAGQKLDALGGMAAMLRYKLY